MLLAECSLECRTTSRTQRFRAQLARVGPTSTLRHCAPLSLKRCCAAEAESRAETQLARTGAAHLTMLFILFVVRRSQRRGRRRTAEHLHRRRAQLSQMTHLVMFLSVFDLYGTGWLPVIALCELCYV